MNFAFPALGRVPFKSHLHARWYVCLPDSAMNSRGKAPGLLGLTLGNKHMNKYVIIDWKML